MATPTPPGQQSRTQLIEALEKYKRAAEETHRRRRPKSGVALSVIGVAVLLTTLVLNAMGRPIGLLLWTGVGFLLLIFGYYVRDPNKALAFGGFVVNGFGGIAAIILRVKKDQGTTTVVVPVVQDTPSEEFPAPANAKAKLEAKLDYEKGRKRPPDTIDIPE